MIGLIESKSIAKAAARHRLQLGIGPKQLTCLSFVLLIE